MTRHEEIAKMMTVLPRMLRCIGSRFVPQVDVCIKKAEIKTLIELDLHPGMPMKHYVDTADIECGSFTYLANKLEGKGLIRRAEATDDRRKTMLELTDMGKRVTTTIKAQYVAYVAKQIAHLEEKDLAQLVKATKLLERILKKLERK